jgi:hypothetical protein
MMQQSSALRRLEEILTEAIDTGDRNQHSGPILLKALKLGEQPQNIVDFYELLNKAEEEAKSIRNKPKIDRYISTIQRLHEVFVVNHTWLTPWDTFATYIEGKGVLNTLDSLADFFYSQNPAILLEKDFLEKLNSEFSSILEEILKSDLSKDLKRFLERHIENIIKAIRRYHIDGTEGLEQATKSLISDLAMKEYSLQAADKENRTYMHATGWFLSLLLYISPSPYDIIGAVPDIYDFWIPKFEELVAGHKKVERIICESPTIQEAFEKAAHTFDRQPQKRITGGRELKALPASEEDPEAIRDDKNDPLNVANCKQ